MARRLLTFTVTRSGDTTGAITFSGTFDKGTTNAADFGGTLPSSAFNGTIAAGATSAAVTIVISGDTTAEASESFTLTLNSATNSSATVTIGAATATGTIANDDGGGTIISSNTSSISFGNNDHVTIQQGVTVSGSNAATWTGGSAGQSAILDNFGNISGTKRGISTGDDASNPPRKLDDQQRSRRDHSGHQGCHQDLEPWWDRYWYADHHQRRN